MTLEDIKQEFEGTNYHELKSVFEKYGVSDAFKAGGRKAEVIERAMEILTKANERVAVEASVEEIPDEDADEIPEASTGLSDTDEASGGDEGKEAVAPYIAPTPQPLKQTKVSKDERKKILEHNLRNAQLNLFTATDSTRKIFLDKIAQIENELKTLG